MVDTNLLERARAVEHSLRELRGVRQARVEIDPETGPTITVLILPEREANVLSDRVKDMAQDLFGEPLADDRIRIMRTADMPVSKQPPRRRLTSLSTRRDADSFSAQVGLSMGADVLMGEAGAPRDTPRESRAVAQAVVSGVKELLIEDVTVTATEILTVGDSRLAIVILNVQGRELMGSALVRLDDHDAIARATLHGLNRIVSGRYLQMGV